MVKIAIDPGEKHCGVAWLDNKDYGNTTLSPRGMLRQLESLLVKGAVELVIVEEFRLYPWKSNQQSFSQMQTVEVIGVIRFLCEKHKVRMVEQKPVDVKAFVPDKKLNDKGWLTGDRHAKDASRHLYYYLKTKEEM